MLNYANVKSNQVISSLIADNNNPSDVVTTSCNYKDNLDDLRTLLNVLAQDVASRVDAEGNVLDGKGFSFVDVQAATDRLADIIANTDPLEPNLADEVNAVSRSIENLQVKKVTSKSNGGNFGVPTEDNEPAVNDYLLKIIKTRINKNGGTHVIGRMLDMDTGRSKLGRREFHKAKGFADDVDLSKGAVIGVGLVEGKIAGVTTYRDKDGVLHYHGGAQHVVGQAISSTGLDYLENYDIDGDIKKGHSLKVEGEFDGKRKIASEIIKLTEQQRDEFSEAADLMKSLGL